MTCWKAGLGLLVRGVDVREVMQTCHSVITMDQPPKPYSVLTAYHLLLLHAVRVQGYKWSRGCGYCSLVTALTRLRDIHASGYLSSFISS